MLIADLRLTRYEDKGAPELEPHKKSTGQLGNAADNTTTDPSKTSEGVQRQVERGQQTAENIRYGQTISEGGMGGMTTVHSGEAEREGYGRVEDKAEDGGAAEQRRKAGYGGNKDMDNEVGG